MKFSIPNKEMLLHLKDPWVATWVISGLLAIFVPVITWNSQKGAYYDTYGYALEAEENQRQYYENQENNNNNNNGNNNGNYYQVYKECAWFNWPCRKRQYYMATMDDNQNDQNGQTLPGWYLFLGGAENSEEMQRWKEDNTGIRTNSSSTPGLKFVYALNLIMFIALLSYGAYGLVKKHNVSNLVVMLGVSASIALMNLIMAAQGVISADDNDMEDSYYGWYGQIGVLMAYTDFWIMLFSLGFLSAFGIRAFLDKKKSEEESEKTNDVEENGGDYKEYKSPEVEMA